MTTDEKTVWDAKYPKEKFISKEYQLSTRELIQLITLDTQAQLGKFAEALFQTFLKQQVMPRIGVADTPDTGLMYNLDEGKFYVAQPIKPATPPPPPLTPAPQTNSQKH